MQNIEGLTKDQTIDALVKYFQYDHSKRQMVHDMFICNYVSDHSRAIGSDVWKFLLHWYKELGYQTPGHEKIYNGCALFWHIKNDGMPNKIAERKQFIRKILENLK